MNKAEKEFLDFLFKIYGRELEAWEIRLCFAPLIPW
jgi:hypothetical protein